MAGTEVDSSSHSRKFEMDSKNLHSGLAHMWHNNYLFDLKLITDDRDFFAHKIVLAASSPYFEAMFTHGFKEEEMIELKDGMPAIVLHSVSSAALEIILKSVYTGELEIQETLLTDLIDLASYLQYEEILYHCEAFMEETVCRENFFDFLELACRYNLEYARNVVMQFLLDNFDIISNPDQHKTKRSYMSRFLELPENVVVECLSNDSLEQSEKIKNEFDLFHLACKWLDHRKERQKSAGKLLRCIRYGHMNSEQLMELSCHRLVLQDDVCLERIMMAEEFLKDELSKPLYPQDLHTPRGDLEFVFLEVPDREELAFSCYNNRDLRVAQEMSPVGGGIMALSVQAVHVGHFVYLLGLVSGTGHYNNTFFRCHESWDHCVMLGRLEGSGRFWGAVGYCDEHIYMAGGILMHDWMMSHESSFHRHVAAGCFKYSIRLNNWETIASLPLRCINGEMASANGLLYLAGPAMYGDGDGAGNDSLHADSFQCLLAYDRTTDEWTNKSPMLHRREKFSMNAVANKLYVMGGYQKISDEEVSHSPSEVYDTETDQWTELEGWRSSPYLWLTPCSFVHKSDIYILGEGQLYGPDGLPERTEYFKDIHIYHTRTKKWSVLNQERELKMESLPYLMSYRIVPRRYRGGKTYPLPRVDVSS